MNQKLDGKDIFCNIFKSVRKITAILLTLVFCYLSIIGRITSEQFTVIFTMVIGYYFGKSTALEKNSKSSDNTNDLD